MSPDENRIAIFNQHNGIDVYKIPGAIWLASYHFTIRDNVMLPVYWIDEGLRLMVGSDSGTVCVWNVKNDSRLPSLLHGKSFTSWFTSSTEISFFPRKLHCTRLGSEAKLLCIVEFS